MPLPTFRADGWLPEGHYAADWDEISAVFGGEPNTKRRDLLNRLLRWRDALRGKGMGGLLILNGSFISQKESPGDVDAIFVFDEFSDALRERDPAAADLLDINRNKADGLGDIFIYCSSTVKRHPTICRLDGFDLHKTTKAPKGVVEVEI